MPSDDNSSQNQVKVISQQDLVVAAVKKASPAVVSVIISKDVPIVEQYYSDPFGGDPFFNQFFGGDNFRFQIPQYKQNGTEKREIGGGTGFIISSDGLILTNKHVVEDESAEYTVLTNDGEKYPAEVLARDLIQDLAIIKIDKKDLPVLNLSNSDNIKIGQTVIAIGNALGEFRNTVSVGVVSGLQRQITAGSGVTSEDLEELIQTDAAINHGNSGGPLLNLAGEVIGVNVAIAQGAQNIGFSIPINKASKDIQQVKSLGKISIPFLGVRYVLINDQVKSKNNLSYNYGAWVQKGSSADQPAVSADSSAEKAGIMEGDIILEVSGKIIDQNHTLAKAIQEYNVGDSISLKIWRQDSEKNINLKLGERP
ncbi:MAG: hypothetical protein COU81_02115 [Candidatus Portnoybacteria bacterium CG10_big_fil_rev_8_21_14_0_10_36_7]|uniref:PDZ domain-containing protein n=1 Tax=Candidatus Portnoybacteria bacterium CG10_big_fil_rev_8_21_14_0_10_36_7 TaxID=1974812 RepID=A0A2M8KE52_9BACT|nr:MAG: hypothetical protein COU81_02115 [Candidatus Portnoybacteria bacterium CG10_big_fil_rev_8_21_14_0_10_36_7]